MVLPDVRRAELADAEALARLAEETFRATFTGTTSSADMEAHCARSFAPEVQRREIEDPRLVTLIATIGERLAGYAQLRISAPKDCVGASSPAELYRLYVAEFWHGKGVAQALMEAVLDIAREQGADAIWLGVWEHNPKATAFYRKYDFQPVGSHPFKLGSDAQTDIVMARGLG